MTAPCALPKHHSGQYVGCSLIRNCSNCWRPAAVRRRRNDLSGSRLTAMPVELPPSSIVGHYDGLGWLDASAGGSFVNVLLAGGVYAARPSPAMSLGAAGTVCMMTCCGSCFVRCAVVLNLLHEAAGMMGRRVFSRPSLYISFYHN